MKNHESFNVAPDAEQAPEMSRHEKKLIGFYLSGGDDHYIFDSKLPRYSEVSVGEAEKGRVLKKMRLDKKGCREMERNLLLNIVSPAERPGGHEKVFSEIKGDKHQMRILGEMTGLEWEDYGDVSKENVEKFMESFPTPIDFEKSKQAFLRDIEANNSNKKYSEYQEAMEAFSQNVYGKKYEYYQAMRKLHAESDGLQELEKKAIDVSRRLGHKLLGIFNTERIGELENAVVDAGVAGISRGELTGKPRRRSEDATYYDPDNGLFGVFDGAGGERGGLKASWLASTTMEELVKDKKLTSTNELAGMMKTINDKVFKDPEAGITTGVVGSIVEKRGKKTLVYASLGDSRLYLVRDGRATQLTLDEGDGRVIYNYLGKEDASFSQFGEVSLKKGDKLLFCSDGVTGDNEEEFVSDEKIAQILDSSKTAEEAAQILVGQVAKKEDDRTAIVVKV